MEHPTHLTDFRDEAFQPFATAVGEMTLAWNDLHEMLKGVFWQALGVNNGVFAYAVWYSGKSDRAQRDMLRALATTPALGNRLTSRTKAEVLWVLNRTDSLEDLRNDVIHSPFILAGSEVHSSWHEGHKRAGKLSGKDVLGDVRKFYEAVVMLRDYAWHVYRVITGSHDTLPERPRLPIYPDSR